MLDGQSSKPSSRLADVGDGDLIGRPLSRRGALRLLALAPAAMMVALGSVASSSAYAQSNNEHASGNGNANDNQTPTPTPNPTRNNGARPNNANNRFAPAPPAPSVNPQPAAPAVAPAGSSQNPAAPALNTETPTALGWVQNHHPTDLWSGPDEKAISFGSVPPFSYFRVLGKQEGPRIRVQNPLTNGAAYITAKDIGPSGAPPEWYLAQKNQILLPARIVGGANIRSTPGIEDGNIISKAGHNAGVTVLGEVKGSDGEMWYRLGPQEFVHGSLVRTPGHFPPHPGRLIVAELAEPCIVTAYEDAKPVYSALALKGTSGWVTPTGFFTILRRVQNETMNSEGLGIPRDAPGGWYLKDVLYTQYFTNDGASIHYNYWSSNWGYSGSHGCLGMNLEDSFWFWEWAEVGTPLVIQE